MVQHSSVTLTLTNDVLRALGHAARAADCAPSDYVRLVLNAALDRGTTLPLAPDVAVRFAIAVARDWLDLQSRLRATGHVLRLSAKSGLWVHSWPLNRPLLPIEELGHSLGGLTLRFRAPFPGDIDIDLAARRSAPTTRRSAA